MGAAQPRSQPEVRLLSNARALIIATVVRVFVRISRCHTRGVETHWEPEVIGTSERGSHSALRIIAVGYGLNRWRRFGLRAR